MLSVKSGMSRSALTTCLLLPLDPILPAPLDYHDCLGKGPSAADLSLSPGASVEGQGEHPLFCWD